MKEKKIKSRNSFTIERINYDRDKRCLHLFGTGGGIAVLPKETHFKRTLHPGHAITVIEYEEDKVIYKMIQQGDLIIGHYGPAEKLMRDQYYKVEVSRKAAGL